QVALATALESRLPEVLASADLESRTAVLASGISSAGAGEVSAQPQGTVTRLTYAKDPLPGLVDVLLGRSDDPETTDAAVRVLADFMAVYHAGGVVRRVRGEGLTLDVSASTAPATAGNPGAETAKWLIDDDLLISAALGLL